jgi:hypothetical protein
MMKLFGYVDPGTGLLAWHLLASAAIGCLFYVKKTRDFVATSVRKIFRRRGGAPETTRAATPIPE